MKVPPIRLKKHRIIEPDQIEIPRVNYEIPDDQGLQQSIIVPCEKMKHIFDVVFDVEDAQIIEEKK